MRRFDPPLLALAAVGVLVACRPDLPGRGCKTNDDCFTHEVCTDGTCADRVASGGAGGEASGGTPTGGDATGGTPTGGDATGGTPTGGTPAPVPDAGAPLDAGAPDAAP